MENKINITDFNFNNLKISNINIDRELSNTSIVNLKKKYYSNKTNKILILDNITKREIILIGNENILIEYTNTVMFDNIYLPEIINLYLKHNNEINNEVEKENENRNFYSINNNLYILNVTNKLLSGIKEYLYKINSENNYKLEISKDYINNDITLKNNNKNKLYSYGYVNILLIALIITITTIIFCLLKY